jgi:hypothetical protein
LSLEAVRLARQRSRYLSPQADVIVVVPGTHSASKPTLHQRSHGERPNGGAIQPGRIEPQNVVQAETAFARPVTS